MLFSVVALVAVVCLTLYWYLTQKNWSFAKNVVVVEPCYPLIGNGLLFVGKDDVRRFWNVKKMFDRKEDLLRFFLGPKMVIGTSDPKTAQQILTEPNCMEKPYFYDYFLIGQGVFTAKSDYFLMVLAVLYPFKYNLYLFRNSAHLARTTESAESHLQHENSGEFPFYFP